MPGMDGLTVIREARRLKADLPVIIITGFSTESSAIEAVNLGVSGYLTKPFRVPRVLAAACESARRARRAVIQLFRSLTKSFGDRVLLDARHLADRRPRARRPVRAQRRRQDDAAQDARRASTSPTAGRSSSRPG